MVGSQSLTARVQEAVMEEKEDALMKIVHLHSDMATSPNLWTLEVVAADR